MIPDFPVALLVVLVVLLLVWGEIRLRQIATLRAAGHLPKRPPMLLLMFGSRSALLRYSERSKQG